MARSEFEGPVIVGDNRFGQLRNVGYVELNQSATILFANQTSGTAGYSGQNGASFCASNNIPNSSAVVYNPSSTVYPPVPATIPADTGTDNYRGWVAYIPAGSRIVQITLDNTANPVATSGTYLQTNVYVSNAFVPNGGVPTYAAGTVSGTGRATISHNTVTQYNNITSTSADILMPNGQPPLSQIVFTFDLYGISQSSTYTAGRFNVSFTYVQPDGNIGTATTYPNGNLD